MEDISKKPLVEIFDRMSKLDTKIDLQTLKIEKLRLELYQLEQELAVMLPEYEELRLEVIKRFPIVKNNEIFQPKEVNYGKNIK